MKKWDSLFCIAVEAEYQVLVTAIAVQINVGRQFLMYGWQNWSEFVHAFGIF